MTKHVVQRDGDRSLCFEGTRIGTGESGTGGTSGFPQDWTRGFTVYIYRTKAGKYVWSRERWSKWQGEKDHSHPASLLLVDRQERHCPLADGLTND